MQTKRFLISAVVMAFIYLGVSYVFSLLFQREFHWLYRAISAVFFGVMITAVTIVLSKRKKRRK